jgi:GTP-binding protein HflX
LRFPREGEVIITDTVGFIKDLPEDLVAAFQATLEELEQADLLLHVVDASDPRLEKKLQAVREILLNLDLATIPQLLVLNKRDLLPTQSWKALAERHPGIPVSAISGEGLPELVAAAELKLSSSGAFRSSRELHFPVP